MRVLGLMSGTSADGIDAALAEISGAPPRLSFHYKGHFHSRFSAGIREKVLRVANGGGTSTEEISRLNFELGGEFARAAIAACRQWRIPISQIALIGSHGQTIFHQGGAEFVGGKRRIASTLQIGEPCIIAERTGVTTIADFRPTDIAAGGQGAPLVPFLDYLLYRHARRGRIALNIGGIANVTIIPAGAPPQEIFAFDTGPGNMIVDALVEWAKRGRERFDRGARLAISGRVNLELLTRLMREPYLRRDPPKTAGREQFGSAFAERLVAWATKHRASPADVVRTATIFTSLSITDALHRFVLPRVRIHDLIVSGGGANNPLMMAQLAAALPDLRIVPAQEWGVPPEAKEAVAFALLAYEAFHGRPNNLPSATGANHSTVMGKLVHGRLR